MPRNYSNIVTAIWNDPDFRALPALAQRTYMMLFSQYDISAAGVLTVSLGRWGRYAADTTAESIGADIDLLAERRFVLVDGETDEVLTRSFIKWDKGYRNPKRRPVLLEAIAYVQSESLRAAIFAELARLDAAPPHGPPGKKPQEDSLFDRPSDALSDTPQGALSDRAPDRVSRVARAEPEPLIEPEPKPKPKPKSKDQKLLVAENSATTPPDIRRPDVEKVCEHLADRIAANGSKRPTIGKAWRTAARLMIDNDKRTVDQIMRCIDWCQTDEFWRTNILGMPKLRKQYDQLRLSAARGHRSNTARPSTTDQAVAQTLALAAELGAEQQPQRRAVAG